MGRPVDRHADAQDGRGAATGDEGVDRWTVNVRVTGDPAAAEAELREVWGGGLCVSRAEYTDEELRAIQKEVGDVDGVLSASVSDQRSSSS